MNIKKQTNIGHYFIIAASVVVVLAGIKMASVIMVPFLFSIFLAIILAPFFLWLKKIGLGEILSLLLIVILLIAIATLLISLVGNSVEDLSQHIPLYEIKLRSDLRDIMSTLEKWGVHIPKEDILEMFQASSVMKYIANTLKSFGSLLSKSFMVILTVAFMLMEISQFTNKLRQTNSNSLAEFWEINSKIKDYIFIKSLTSAATGIIITMALKYIGIHYAILWGLVAFMLNFIPTIGSIIAALPALLMAIIQFSPTVTLIVGALYLIVNVVIGTILEPRILGRGLGLSPLIVFLSLIFWGWMLGPLGMLLSVPLTILIKIALDTQPNTKWIALLLGTGNEFKNHKEESSPIDY